MPLLKYDSLSSTSLIEFNNNNRLVIILKHYDNVDLVGEERHHIYTGNTFLCVLL